MEFVTYIRECSGRKTERYFKAWENAEKQLSEDTETICKNGGTVLENVDFFNRDKGFPVRYKSFLLDGNKITISLVTSYFVDE